MDINENPNYWYNNRNGLVCKVVEEKMITTQ